MRHARIYYKGVEAGVLSQTDEGYEFVYAEPYLKVPDSKPISLTMPLRAEAYKSNILFPFFDGLIPEGWLLDVALRNTDLSELDRFELLLLCCSDCIGCVSVREEKEMENV